MTDKPVVSIVYFSGTGCTKLVAEHLAYGLTPLARSVRLASIQKDMGQPEPSDLLLLLFPVHAFNAPQPIYEWIEHLPMGNGRNTAVFSISGGGDVFPNRACRNSAIYRLKKRGYAVFYEQMITMPNNIFIETPLPAAQLLLTILPEKTEEIAKELVAGSRRREKLFIANRLLSSLGELEKVGARWSGKAIKANERCNGCGVCESGCPVGNIKLRDGKPIFSNRCSLCMKCIYSCPKKALGFSLLQKAVLKRQPCLQVAQNEVPDVEAALLSIKGIAWIGVRKYINENKRLLEQVAVE